MAQITIVNHRGTGKASRSVAYETDPKTAVSNLEQTFTIAITKTLHGVSNTQSITLTKPEFLRIFGEFIPFD